MVQIHLNFSITLFLFFCFSALVCSEVYLFFAPSQLILHLSAPLLSSSSSSLLCFILLLIIPLFLPYNSLQFFNEYTSRKLWNEFNIFSGIEKNKMFAIVSIVTFGLQIFLIEVGGDFVKTSPLTLIQWLITIALGFIGVPIGMLMRLIPISEDPNTFFTSSIIGIEDDEKRDSDTNSDDNNSPLDDLEDDIKNDYVDVELNSLQFQNSI